MNARVLKIFILVLFIPNSSFTQLVNSKVGGICFRVDDNQSISNWDDYANVFARYSYNFTFALNSALFEKTQGYVSLIDKLQQAGHEYSDHTPNHDVRYFTTDKPDSYKLRKGIHHIVGNKVDLAYDSFDTTGSTDGDGLVEIRNNIIISKTIGAFKNIQTGNSTFAGVYLSSLQKFLTISQLKNSDTLDVDTLIVRNFWGEDIYINDAENTPLKFIHAANVRMNTDGLALLAERTLEISEKLGITRPYVWIQPGGDFPLLSSNDVKVAFSDNFKYRAAAVYPNSSAKGYGEEDHTGERRFAMEWGDFLEDASDFHTVRSIIADKIAKHYVLIGHSHFNNLNGGWIGYLARMDSLLAWCKANYDLIPVKIYSEWAFRLYESPQNPYTNIIPPLYIDLDDNNVPDGYYAKAGYTDGKLNTIDGVPASGGVCYSIDRTGNIFTISRLAGLEKGENDFFIWTKGNKGDSVQVSFYYPGTAYQPTVLKFPATTNEWTKYGLSQSTNGEKALNVPYDVSFVDIFVRCSNYSAGTIKVCGLELRKKIIEPLKIISQAPTIIRINDDYTYTVKAYALWPNDTLSYRLIGAPEWLNISHDGVISGHTPMQKGVFPVSYLIYDQHKNIDSQYFPLSVENRKILITNTSKISLGDMAYHSQKDTVFTLTNDGLDTTAIYGVTAGSYLSVLPVNPKLPPKQSINIKVKLFANIFGVINSFIKIASDAENIVDSIKITANSGMILDSQRIVTTVDQYALYQNYPNPFNAGTVINYSIKSGSKVSVVIYNVLGQTLKTILASEIQLAGRYQVQWTGDDNAGAVLGSGVYFCRMTVIPQDGSQAKEMVKKMLLLR